MFHLVCNVVQFRFFTRDQNSSVISILNYHCVFGEQTKVVGEDAVEQRAESRALKNADAVLKWVKLFGVA